MTFPSRPEQAHKKIAKAGKKTDNLPFPGVGHRIVHGVSSRLDLTFRNFQR